MSKLRFSIPVLMAAIAVCAVGLTAWRSVSYAWFSALYGMTILALLLATIAARYRPGSSGAFWFGFALFGWAYFFLSVSPWSDWRTSSRQFKLEANKFLPSHILLKLLVDYQARHLMPQIPEKNMINDPVEGRRANFTSAEKDAYIAAYETYINVDACLTGIAHVMAVWPAGILGGLAARFIYARSRSSGECHE